MSIQFLFGNEQAKDRWPRFETPRRLRRVAVVAQLLARWTTVAAASKRSVRPKARVAQVFGFEIVSLLVQVVSSLVVWRARRPGPTRVKIFGFVGGTQAGSQPRPATAMSPGATSVSFDVLTEMILTENSHGD